jgi:hypothetical protein
MGLRPTQEDEKPADQEDLFPPFRTKNKKLWVPHISRSEMWEGCRTAVGQPEVTTAVLNTFQPGRQGCSASSLPHLEIWGTHSF